MTTKVPVELFDAGAGFTIGSGAAEDTKIVFDGNAQDFYIGLDDSADDLLIGLGSTVGTTPAVVIDENLKVGIGAAPTLGALHVTSSLTDIVTFENTDAGTTGAQLILYHNSSSPADGDRVGALNFKGQDDAGNDATYAGIRCLATDVSNTTEDGTLTFSTTRAGTFTEAMRIDSSGNVGIGITSPTNALHAYNSANSTPFVVESTTNTFLGIKNTSQTAFVGAVGTAMTFENNGSEAMRIDSSRRFLLGTTTVNIDGASGSGVVLRDNASSLFTVESDECMGLNRRNNDGVILRFRNDGSSVGTISTGSNSLPSDRNFKRDIEDLEIGLDLIKKLKPSQYNYKIQDEDAPKLYGLIAQDLEQSLAEVGVEKNSTSLLQHNPNDNEKESDYDLDYLKLTPVLINAIQEQQTQIEALQSEINTLKGE